MHNYFIRYIYVLNLAKHITKQLRLSILQFVVLLILNALLNDPFKTTNYVINNLLNEMEYSLIFSTIDAIQVTEIDENNGSWFFLIALVHIL